MSGKWTRVPKGFYKCDPSSALTVGQQADEVPNC